MPSPNNPPGKRLFIGGVPFNFREGQLLSLFVTCGKVIDVRIIKDKQGNSRGMAYLEFENIDNAVTAQKKFHNHHVTPDRTIIVDFARPDPFLTPEGKARHLQALNRKKDQYLPPPKDKSPSPRRSDSPAPSGSLSHMRPSLYQSRRYGSRIGAKFARRTGAKKSR